MRPSLRSIAVATSLALVAFAAVPGASAAAVPAASPATIPAASAATSPEGAVSIRVGGLLRVVPLEAAPIDHEEGGAVAAPAEVPAGYEYSLLSDAGVALPLDTAPTDAATGDRVEVDLELPADVADRLSTGAWDEIDAAPASGDANGTDNDTDADTDTDTEGTEADPDGTVVNPSPELLAEIAAATLEIDATLPGTGWNLLGARAAAQTAPAAHQLNVAIMTQPGESSTGIFSDAVVNRILGDLGAYWVQQTGGQVSGLASVGGYKRISQQGCDSGAAWSKAAAAFGASEQSYYDGSRSTPTHLVVIASKECGAGTGYGSIGTGVGYGGEIWAVIDPGVTETQVIAHEFGHNISLGHSNAVVCPGSPQAVETSPPCSDSEYGDYYDVMAGGYLFHSGETVLASTDPLAALNVTHRVHLGVLADGKGLQTVALSGTQTTKTVTASLAAASATSGIRGIAVTDPKSGDTYYLEYRSGTGTSVAAGRDADAFYRKFSAYDPSYGIGVRVLRLRIDDRGFESSAALRDTAATDDARPRFLAAGASLSTDLGGVTVAVASLSPSTATVTITLGAVDVSGVTTRDRISGPTRYETAVALSKAAFPGGAPVVYLATGGNYPDALAAGPAAAEQGGPLLLTPPDALPTTVRTELLRLKPAKIVIVGGTTSVSAAVAKAATSIAPVTRLSGPDRYATGRAIVDYAFTTAPAVFVATGANYPDALSAGAAGAAGSLPVVLVEGQGEVDPATAALLKGLGTTKVTIAGGPNSVSEWTENSLHFVGSVQTVDRLSGADRYQTSAAINAAYFAAPTTRVLLASGTGFADALAGGPVAARFGAPLYVVPPSCVSLDVLAALERLGTEHVTLIGGTASLGAGVQQLKRC